MIIFDCPECGRPMQAGENLAGQQVRCPGCQAVARVPQTRSAAPSEPLHEPEVAPRFPGLGTGGAGGEEQRRPCPMCGEMILASAVKCRFCGEVFDPALKRAEAKRHRGGGASDEELTVAEVLVAILCSGIGCIIGVIWMLQGKSKGTKMFLISIVSSIVWSALNFALTGGKGFR